MRVLKDMSLAEFREALVERGMKIGYEKMMLAIDLGVFPFVHKIPMSRNEYIILQSDFEKWADEHSVELVESDT